MKDWLGREIEYLRLSVTRGCNLNCIYCSSGDERKQEACGTELSPEEMGQLVASMARLGLRRVRLTGGEPLTRADICGIITRISAVPDIKDLSMTTNGIKLEAVAADLKQAGLNRINVSLDSLRPERFRHLTGGGNLDHVLKGIDMAVTAGLNPVKINMVLIKGVNDDEIGDFFDLARQYPVEVRFIELMPVGRFGEDNRDKRVGSAELRAAHPEMKPLSEGGGQSGPAEVYSIDGYKGRIGLISAMSRRFCDRCNRVRLTSDGMLKPCLGHNDEYDIAGVLRNNPEGLDKTIRDIIFNKPEGHLFHRSFASQRSMDEIGG